LWVLSRQSLLFWLCLVTAITTNLEAESSTGLITQTGLRQFSTEQGLSQNTIRNFYQDKDGFVWIATDAGLNRLDGLQTVIIPGPEQSLSANAINRIFQDSTGRMWIATFGALYHLEKSFDQAQIYHLPDTHQSKGPRNFALNLFENADGSFWVVTQQGVYRLSLPDSELLAFDSTNLLAQTGARVHKASEVGDFIWLATDKGLFRFDKRDASLSQVTLPSTFERATFNHFAVISEYEFVIATSAGLLLAQSNADDTFEFKRLTENSASAATVQDGQVFFSSKDRLFRYLLDSEQLQHVFSLSALLPRYTNYEITELFVDRSKNLWLGTDSQGAFLWNPTSLKFKTISSISNNPTLKLTSNLVWNFHQDKRENFWIATDNGLNYLDVASAKVDYHLDFPENNQSDSQARLMDVFAEGKRLWLASADGLIRYDPVTRDKKIYRPTGFSEKNPFFIYAIAQTPDGTLWLAAEAGIWKFNPAAESFGIERALRSMDKNDKSTFVRYQDNLLWFGFKDRLISYDYQRRHKKEILRVSHSIQSNDLFLTDFLIDGPFVWAAFSGEGIYIFERKNSTLKLVKHLNRRTGFPDNMVYTLLPGKGGLWATTHSGLVFIERDSFRFLLYDFYDGLPSNEFNEGAGISLGKGKFLLGGANGITLVDSTILLPPLEINPPVITGVQLQERNLIANAESWAQRALTLKPNERLLVFELSPLDFLSPKKWQYQYWLSGAKKTQPKITNKSQLIFNDLAAGEYTLHVRAVLPDYKIFPGQRQISFKVERQSWISKQLKTLSYPALAVLLFTLLYRRGRVKQKFMALYRELQEKESRLELALLDRRRGIWEWNSNGDGDGENSNDALISVTINESETISFAVDKFISYIHPDDLAQVTSSWEELVSGHIGKLSLAYRVYFFDQLVWIRVIGSIYQRKDDASPLRITGTWLDITEEKKAEEHLRLYQLAVQSTRDIIIIVDANLRVITVNNALQTLTSLSNDQVVGKNIFQVANTSLSDAEIQRVVQQVKRSGSWQGEAKLPGKSGDFLTTRIRVDAIEQDEQVRSFVIVISDLSTPKSQQQDLSALYDKETGLPGKALANDRLIHGLKSAAHNNTPLALVVLEIGELKARRQNPGKKDREVYLTHLCQLIVKTIDTAHTFSRLSDDRFVLLMENIKNPDQVSFVVARLLQQITDTIQVGRATVEVKASAGIACFPEDALEPEQLLDHACEAVNRARKTGVASFAFHNREQNNRSGDRLAMKLALARAIDNHEFSLVYQPKLDLVDQTIVGFEALLRWRPDDEKVVYPSQFIAIAEETGQIEPITHWLIDNALAQLSEWKQVGIETHFAINIVPRHSNEQNYAALIKQKLDEYQLHPNSIHIEIDEKDFSENLTIGQKLLGELTDIGLRVTLDNFGAGGTPLLNLRRLPLHAIKLERTFVRDLGKNDENDTIVLSILALASSLGLKTSAKSIETAQQFDFLLNAHCDFGQGYYFSDPLDEPDARSLVLSKNQ